MNRFPIIILIIFLATPAFAFFNERPRSTTIINNQPFDYNVDVNKINEDYIASVCWLLDGSNAPPSADWNMGQQAMLFTPNWPSSDEAIRIRDWQGTYDFLNAKMGYSGGWLTLRSGNIPLYVQDADGDLMFAINDNGDPQITNNIFTNFEDTVSINGTNKLIFNAQSDFFKAHGDGFGEGFQLGFTEDHNFSIWPVNETFDEPQYPLATFKDKRIDFNGAVYVGDDTPIQYTQIGPDSLTFAHADARDQLVTVTIDDSTGIRRGALFLVDANASEDRSGVKMGLNAGVQLTNASQGSLTNTNAPGAVGGRYWARNYSDSGGEIYLGGGVSSMVLAQTGSGGFQQAYGFQFEDPLFAYNAGANELMGYWVRAYADSDDVNYYYGVRVDDLPDLDGGANYSEMAYFADGDEGYHMRNSDINIYSSDENHMDFHAPDGFRFWGDTNINNGDVNIDGTVNAEKLIVGSPSYSGPSLIAILGSYLTTGFWNLFNISPSLEVGGASTNVTMAFSPTLTGSATANSFFGLYNAISSTTFSGQVSSVYLNYVQPVLTSGTFLQLAGYYYSPVGAVGIVTDHAGIWLNNGSLNWIDDSTMLLFGTSIPDGNHTIYSSLSYPSYHDSNFEFGEGIKAQDANFYGELYGSKVLLQCETPTLSNYTGDAYLQCGQGNTDGLRGYPMTRGGVISGMAMLYFSNPTGTKCFNRFEVHKNGSEIFGTYDLEASAGIQTLDVTKSVQDSVADGNIVSPGDYLSFYWDETQTGTCSANAISRVYGVIEITYLNDGNQLAD